MEVDDYILSGKNPEAAANASTTPVNTDAGDGDDDALGDEESERDEL